MEKSIQNSSEDNGFNLDDYLNSLEPEVANVEVVEAVPTDPRLQGSLSDKISYFYEKCFNGATKEADKDYIEELYNPATTSLDNSNLLLNLRVLYRMQQLKTIDFYYDEDLSYEKKGFTDEINLLHSWWNPILESEVTDEEKYVKIAEKNIIAKLYSQIFRQMYENGDKTTYNEHLHIRNNLISEASDENIIPTLEEGMLGHIRKRTVDGSLIMLTKDMVEYFDIKKPTDLDVLALSQIEADDEFLNNNGETKKTEAYVKYLGVWENRDIYVVNTERVQYLRGVDHFAFFINNGINNRNKYLVNPTKPLVYYNVIDNPLLSKPVIQYFGLLDYKFFQTATTIFRFDDTEHVEQ